MKDSLQALFREECKHINYFFDNVDLHATHAIFQELLSCKGTILFTGIGKSGMIAQKLAVTMISTGTRSFYVPATDALHGDLGIVKEQDLFVLLSKSGATKELVTLLPFVRAKGAKTIAIVSEEQSQLFQACDLSICLPIPRELCPFGLVPTTSTEVQLIFGNILAVALMHKKNFSLQEYARNHPAGSIGKKITLKVSDLMLTGKSLPLASKDSLLIEVLLELSEKKCGCVLIVNKENELEGIFTDGDLRRAIQKKKKEALSMPLSQFMTTAPKFITQDCLAFDAVRMMEEDPTKLITVLPVLHHNKIEGLIRMHDILQACS